MDQDIALSKLASLARCVQRIEQRLPATPALLAADPDSQDIIALNLQRAVQLCVDLALMIVAEQELAAPSNMAEAFERLAQRGWISEAIAGSMRSAVGFRNISVHEYRKLDWQIVHVLASQRLDDFRRFAAELADSGLLGAPP